MKKLKTFFCLMLSFCMVVLSVPLASFSVLAAGGEPVWWRMSPDDNCIYLRNDEQPGYENYNAVGGKAPWLKQLEEDDNVAITSVVVETPIKPDDLSFKGLADLVEIDGIENIDTSEMTNMNGMFSGCESLETLDLSKFDTSKVTDMSNMFSGCESLESVEFGDKFTTNNVKTMAKMFSDCTYLEELDLSKFQGDEVTGTFGMFYNCESLTGVSFGNFGGAKLTNMESMFEKCESLTNVDLSGFNTVEATTFENMFKDCFSLEKAILGNNFVSNKVTVMRSMFENCETLGTLDLSAFDTDNVTDFAFMFSGCSELSSLDIRNFDTTTALYTDDMLKDCNKLQVLWAQKAGKENIALPIIMQQDPTTLQAGDDVISYALMPANGSKKLIPVLYDGKPITDVNNVILIKKLMNGSYENVGGFEFRVYTKNGEYTGINAISNAAGHATVDVTKLSVGEYYIQEVKGKDKTVYYNPTKQYFNIKALDEKILGRQLKINGVEYLNLNLGDLNNYEFSALGYTVYAKDKQTGEVLVFKSYCAAYQKRIPGKQDGPEQMDAAYIDPDLAKIKEVRGPEYKYEGPHADNITLAIKCILTSENESDADKQHRIWDLLDLNKEIDLSNANQIPDDFQFALISPKDSSAQPMIISLSADKQKIEVGDGSMRMLDRKEVVFDNLTQEEFKFAKCDQEGKRLAGAVIKIERIVDNGELDHIVTWTSSENDQPVYLAEGDYILTEEKAPDGYQKAEQIMFTIEKTQDGSLQFKEIYQEVEGTFLVGIDTTSILKGLTASGGGSSVTNGQQPLKAAVLVNAKMTTTTTTSESGEVPDTGDNISYAIYTMVASALGFVTLAFISCRKKKQEEE